MDWRNCALCICVFTHQCNDDKNELLENNMHSALTCGIVKGGTNRKCSINVWYMPLNIVFYLFSNNNNSWLDPINIRWSFKLHLRWFHVRILYGVLMSSIFCCTWLQIKKFLENFSRLRGPHNFLSNFQYLITLKFVYKVYYEVDIDY